MEIQRGRMGEETAIRGRLHMFFVHSHWCSPQKDISSASALALACSFTYPGRNNKFITSGGVSTKVGVSYPAKPFDTLLRVHCFKCLCSSLNYEAELAELCS